MRRRAVEAGHENHERWLVSYADFITLLFAFFVVMFASSQTDKTRAKQVSDSVNDALKKGGIKAAVRQVLGGTPDDRGRGNALLRGPGGAQAAVSDPPPATVKQAELLPSLNYLAQQLEREIREGKVQLRLETRGLVVSLRQAAFFPSGEDVIDPRGYPTLTKIAALVRHVPNEVRLEGHTDSVPIHSPRFRDNWALSAARSLAMLELLADRFGVERRRMSVAGYADTMPVDRNDTPEGRAHNRRVDLVLVAIQGPLRVPPPAGPPPESSRPSKK